MSTKSIQNEIEREKKRHITFTFTENTAEGEEKKKTEDKANRRCKQGKFEQIAKRKTSKTAAHFFAMHTFDIIPSVMFLFKKRKNKP